MIQNYFNIVVFLIVNFYRLPSASPENSISGIKIPEIRIINGYTCSTNDYPFMVKIIRGYNKNNAIHNCGGTLIRPDWVLSAAHCFDSVMVPKIINFWIQVGFDNPQSRQTVEVETWYVHPKWIEETFANDIAMVKLRHPVEYEDGISNAKLARSNDPVCSKAVIVGWGRMSNSLDPEDPPTPNLQCGSVNIIASEKCFEESSKKGYYPFHIHTQICTFSRQKEAEARFGDSGGPLLCSDVQVGIVSFKFFGERDPAKANFSIETPLVYTSVQYFLDFINDTMNNSGTMHSRSIFIIFIIFFTLLQSVILFQ